MKKSILSIALMLLLGSASAMTEDEMVAAAAASQAQVKAGTRTELAHNKYVYQLVADMPASYAFRAENLRLFGARIDTLEAVEAGKITKEKGRRDLLQQEADYEAESLKREKDAASRAEAAGAQQRARNEAMAAQEEAQRRALAIQFLQNRPAPYQIPLPQTPQTTKCYSTPVYGGGMETVCR